MIAHEGRKFTTGGNEAIPQIPQRIKASTFCSTAAVLDPNQLHNNIFYAVYASIKPLSELAFSQYHFFSNLNI